MNPDNFLLCRPLLSGVAAGSVEPRRAAVPLRNLCPHADLVVGSVTGLDARRRIASVTTDTGRCAIAYADLVVALGSGRPTPTAPGLAEHAFGLDDLRAAVALRDHVLRQVELAGFDPGSAADRLTFVVAGAPHAVVDTVAELVQLSAAALRQHPRLRHVHARWLVIREADLPIRRDRALRDRGVEIVGGATVGSVTPTGVVLADGRRIATRTAVWCPPATPHPVLAQLGLPLDAGRLRVDETLRVAPRVWALGDCAAIPRCSPSGDTAGRPVRKQARVVAVNVRNPPRRYRAPALDPIRMVGLSGHRAGGSIAAGHRLNRHPFVSRRLRAVLDWITAALFCRDLAELSRSNGGDNDANP